jgi:hypothetical protein
MSPDLRIVLDPARTKIAVRRSNNQFKCSTGTGSTIWHLAARMRRFRTAAATREEQDAISGGCPQPHEAHKSRGS